MNDLITIYILNRNYSTFWRNLLKCSRANIRKLDIIIIDDASSDSLINVLNKFQKKAKEE